jgi:DNA-binding response OmpR family regulator
VKSFEKSFSEEQLRTDHSRCSDAGMDGFEIAETISGYSKTEDVPVIFLSAVNTDKKFITKGFRSGAIDYITKPIDPDILLLKS